MFKNRLKNLQKKLNKAKIDVSFITDEDSIYYFTGYHDYLHMEFGRPTILILCNDNSSYLITPNMEKYMAEEAARVDQIYFWNDGMGEEWREKIPDFIFSDSKIGLEPNLMPPIVQNYLFEIINKKQVEDITPIIQEMRMIKSSEELKIARHAGEVANAMMSAGRDAIKDGAFEYEIALATSSAGTIKASELLKKFYNESSMSPNTQFLQIMASGNQISKPHHRASTRKMNKGEPVFLCFCGMTNFNRFKLGFDRMFWIGHIENKQQEMVYEIALKSQAAALEMLKPGVLAEEIHFSYAEIIRNAGYNYPFRCGRGTGYSFLENPQIVSGDKTVIQPGMVLAIDGSVTLDNSFRAQVGDSYIVTENGYEQLTSHPKSIEDIII
tara:strand:- start:200 stop:1348 length:1149 start_codon:yes stop_codon:yes gene_type:complete